MCACVNVCVCLVQQVEVAAWTVDGQGPFSAGIDARTAEGAPTIAPTNVAIDSTTDNTATVSWDAVNPDTVPGTLIGYTISIRQVCVCVCVCLSVSLPPSPLTITLFSHQHLVFPPLHSFHSPPLPSTPLHSPPLPTGPENGLLAPPWI